MYDIVEVHDPNERMRICEAILRALPDWFGNESATVDYIAQSRALPLIAAYDGGAAIGFISVMEHNAYTAEIHVMGVLPSHHRGGAGRALVAYCEQYCRASGREFLTVKTLADLHPDEGYAKTRAFYTAVGFRPLEVFPLLWGDANSPCLFMAKRL